MTRVELTPPDWRLDPDAIARAIRPKTAMVVLANPSNPTGRYHSWETVRAVYEHAADAGAFLLCDEVYRMLADDPLLPVASLGDHGISTASLTKAWGLAGARFGWLVGSVDVVASAWRWKDYTTISPSPFGQHLARQAFANESALLSENRDFAHENRDRVRAFVDDHGLDWLDPVGVYGFPTVPNGFDDARAFCTTVIEEESIVLAPGDLFGHPGRFRIGFGLPTDRLEVGLQRLGRVIDRRA